MDIENIRKLNLGGFPPIIKIDNFINKKREFTRLNSNINNNLNILNILNIDNIYKN
jgi:hypothetical protein